MRRTIAIPDDLYRDLKPLVGSQSFTQFVCEALRGYVHHLEQEAQAQEIAEGSRGEAQPLASRDQQYLEHLRHQYDVLWKHLEYVDSHIFKIVGFYFVFMGAILAKLDWFLQQPWMSAAFVLALATVFFVFLHRISQLLQVLKGRIVEVEHARQALHGKPTPEACPAFYSEGLRTSVVSKWAVIFLSLLLAMQILAP